MYSLTSTGCRSYVKPLCTHLASHWIVWTSCIADRFELISVGLANAAQLTNVFCRKRLGASFISRANVGPICDQLFGGHGLASIYPAEVESTYTAVQSLVRDNVETAMPDLMPRIEQALDRRDAEALSPAEITILNTPEGTDLLLCWDDIPSILTMV